MGDRSHVFNVGDLEPAPVQRTNGGFAARAGTHHPNLDVFHAMLLGRGARALRGNLGREGGRFARTAETASIDLREPRKPHPPEVAQDSVLPCRSVMVMMVLLKEACTCAIASSTFFRTFLRAGLAAPAVL